MFATGTSLTFAEFNMAMDYICVIMAFVGGYVLARASR